MEKIIIINGKEKLCRSIQIDANAYKIVVFNNEVTETEFTVSLQPTGKEDGLPTYQLLPKNQNVSQAIKNILPDISKWLMEYTPN